MATLSNPVPRMTREVALQRVPFSYYRPGMDCPCCGWGAFYVGRTSAECGRCAAAIPLAQGVQ